MIRLWLKSLCAAALAALVFIAAPAAQAQDLDDAIIARVNGEAILLSQLKEAGFDQQIRLSAGDVAKGAESEKYRRAMTRLVDETLLIQKAKAEEIGVNEVQISRQVEEMIRTVREQLGGQDKLDEFLKSHNLTLEGLRSVMIERERRGALAAQVVAKRVSVDAGMLEQFIKERKAKHAPVEEVCLAQILFRCSEADRAGEVGKALYQKALKLARELGGDTSKFAEYARQYSDDPGGRVRGGQLGWVEPQGLRDPLREQVAKMQPGDVSPPIATEEGYHVLLLSGRHSTRELAYMEQFARERERLIEQLRADASIQVYDLKGQAIPEAPAPAPKAPASKK